MHRRDFLSGLSSAAVSPLFTLPAHAQAELAIIWIATNAASGVVSYLGGRAMSSVLSGDGQPTSADIINAINNSARELKDYIHDDIRSAIEEKDLRDLADKAETTRRCLLAFSRLTQQEREHRLDYIIDADRDTRSGIVTSETHAPLSLPLMALFVSLRTMTVKLRYDHDRLDGPYLAYKEEIQSYFRTFWYKLGQYNRHMFDNRVGPLQCSFAKESGPGFHINSCTCSFSLDGKFSDATKLITGAQVDCSIFNIHAGEELRNKFLVSTSTEYSTQILPKFIVPLSQIGQIFYKIAQDWQV